jgi:hypothetical protein
VPIVFRTKEWLSLPQLVDAWGSELAKVGEEPNRSQKALEHVLLEDIINVSIGVELGPPIGIQKGPL